jgi:hypothetical protein
MMTTMMMQVSDISKAFSPVVFPGHAKLSKKEKVEWDSRSRSVTLWPSLMIFLLLVFLTHVMQFEL